MSNNARKIEKENLQAQLQDNPGVILENVARNGGFSMVEVIELLPENMWKKTEGARFVEIMQHLATIGDVTLIVNTPDVIMEYSGKLPEGTLAHGSYNFHYKSPLHGHLYATHCQSIYLVERTLMKKQTMSSQSMNQEGNAMFKVFASRDESGNLKPSQVAYMRALFETAIH